MNWRDQGRVLLPFWLTYLGVRQSPLANESCWRAAGAHSRFLLAVAIGESQGGTHFNRNTAANKNALNLRPPLRRDGTREPGDYMTFVGWADGVQTARERITSLTYGNGIYEKTGTVLEFAHVWAPASDDNDPAAFAAAIEQRIRSYPRMEDDRMALNMTRGLIPLPAMIRDIIDVGKRDQSRACRGYDWLGLRPDPPEFLVLHRPQSPAQASISNYFHQRCCPALTDLECSSITGQFRRFVERGDAPSGWANGVVSNPYGDALKYLDHYGWDLNRVNRCGEAVEVSGWFAQPGTSVTQEDPISEACWQTLAQWSATRAHDYGIPWDQFPIIPGENNRSYITWHREWTIGTGKVCPGRVLMDGTARLIEMTRAIMRTAQTETAAPEPEIPQYAPLNVPDFLTPKWINGGEDATFDNGVKVFSLRRRWQARVETPRLQHAGPGAPVVGPALPAGRSTIGVGLYKSHGRYWVLTEWGERLRMADMTDALTPSYPDREAA